MYKASLWLKRDNWNLFDLIVVPTLFFIVSVPAQAYLHMRREDNVQSSSAVPLKSEEPLPLEYSSFFFSLPMQASNLILHLGNHVH